VALWACIVCGTPSPARRCPRHAKDRNARNAPRSPNRDRTLQARFRRLVLARDGHACTRCGSRHKLDAHHIRPGYDIDAGITLCNACHTEVDSHARPR
jgi:hypothetical protein